jgi:hypothetical protein
MKLISLTDPKTRSEISIEFDGIFYYAKVDNKAFFVNEDYEKVREVLL